MYVVLYHHPCTDGSASAWIASRFLPENTRYIGLHPNDPVPLDKIRKGNYLYILDLSFSAEELKPLVDESVPIVLLDHHKSAEPRIKELKELGVRVLYDPDECGATLTAHWFGSEPDEFPILKYVRDRDIWLHRMYRTEDVAAYLQTVETFEQWDRANRLLMSNENLVFEAGAAVRQYKERSIRMHLENSILEEMFDMPVPTVNCTDKNLISDLLHRMAEKYGVAKSFRTIATADGPKIEMSLRSRENGPDVSKWAERFGGGGHKHAAGYVIEPRLLEMAALAEVQEHDSTARDEAHREYKEMSDAGTKPTTG